MESTNTVSRGPGLQLSSHIPQLDGVRGIAILAVMLVHSADRLNSLSIRSAFRYGWVGVDLFFVLSGFLITRILLQARGSDHFFRNFYVLTCSESMANLLLHSRVGFRLSPFGASSLWGRGVARN